MRRASRIVQFVTVVVLAGTLVFSSAWVWAWQDPAAKPAEASKEQEVQILREALSFSSPTQYKQHLSLSPSQVLEVPAPADGYVRAMSIKVGGKIGKESEMLRLDDVRANLVLKGAKARLLAAQVEKKLAKDPDQQALADANIEAAQAAVDLAKFDLDRLVIRAPFAGELHAVHVVEGQFVRAGQSLATLADVSKLQVEVPIDSTTAKVGADLELKIAESATKGKVEALLPLNRRFEPLRELSDTLQSAVTVFDNAAGKLLAGQTVYCDLIPLAPVASVPTVAVKNNKAGSWKVQVLRHNVVRDITVKTHSKVGTERMHVSGPFQEGDELITKASIELTDGTPVRELLASAAATTGAKPGAAQQKPKTGTTSEGF